MQNGNKTLRIMLPLSNLSVSAKRLVQIKLAKGSATVQLGKIMRHPIHLIYKDTVANTKLMFLHLLMYLSLFIYLRNPEGIQS